MVTPAMLHLVLELRTRPRQFILVYSSFHLFILLFFTNHLEDSVLSPHPSRKSSHLYSFRVAEDCLTSLIPSEAATPEYLLPLDNSVVDEKTSIGNQDRRRKAIGMSLEARIPLFEDMREKAKNARDYLGFHTDRYNGWEGGFSDYFDKHHILIFWPNVFAGSPAEECYGGLSDEDKAGWEVLIRCLCVLPGGEKVKFNPNIRWIGVKGPLHGFEMSNSNLCLFLGIHWENVILGRMVLLSN